MFRWMSYLWTIPVNQFFKSHLISPQFASTSDPEVKFRLKIYPSGSRKRHYFSVFVICDSNDTSFQTKLSVTILNSQPKKNYGQAVEWSFQPDSYPFGWKSFIKIDDLVDRNQGFVNDECIQIWCIIGFNAEPIPRLVWIPKEETKMDDGKAECYFEYGNDKLALDCNIITQHSEIFKNDFNNDSSFIKLLPPVSLAIIKKFVEYFQEKSFGRLNGHELEALILADALQMVELKESCESRLAKQVLPTNLKKFTCLATKYNASLIMEKCDILQKQLASKCQYVI